MTQFRVVTAIAAALAAILTPTLLGAAPSSAEPSASLLVSGLQGSFGSTVGPGGDLYVVEGVARRVSRVDPETGTVTTFASGLPAQVIPGVGLPRTSSSSGGPDTCWSSSSVPSSVAPMR